MLQASQIRISDGREIAAGLVHPIADAVGDDDIARHAQSRDIARSLLKRALNTYSQATAAGTDGTPASFNSSDTPVNLAADSPVLAR